MIDAYLASRGNPSDFEVLDSYQPSDAIVDFRFHDTADAEELCFVFPPWHGAKEVTSKLESTLVNKRGKALMAYDLHDHILEPSIKTVIASHEAISDHAAEQINRFAAERPDTRLHLLGMSLGNAALAMTLPKIENLDRFERLTAVVPGSRLAPSLWDGVRTQGMRTKFEQDGIGLEELDQAWQNLSPSNYASYLRGKSVNVFLSTTDGFIPPEYGEAYVADLQAAEADLRVRRSNLGHAMNIIKFCVRTPKDI